MKEPLWYISSLNKIIDLNKFHEIELQNDKIIFTTLNNSGGSAYWTELNWKFKNIESARIEFEAIQYKLVND